ncbi:hypothetical protein EMCG_05628 [[Emmonsia] crescens]|uniref:Uncharacterized protein n=1 Tax=[Emmonsia] crescens TaxID=73230 RepID=A0A0G2IDK4_9EURO|nr:hypothetical protein EMCG_05628 [Emmonsia crescens UAMH 3008]
MAAITRRVTDSSAIAAFHIAAVARMELEVEHFKKIKKLLDKVQDQFRELKCDKDEVRVVYQTLKEARDLVLDGKATKESHINEEEPVLVQFFVAEDVSRAIKPEICACINHLRVYRRKCEDETQDSGCNFDNKDN